MLKSIIFTLAAAGAVVFAAPVQAGHHEGGNIVETAQDAGSFNTLLAAAKAAGLADTLANGGPFTVFAPTDAAFEVALSELGVTAEQLLADKAKLRAILLHHVIEGRVTSGDLAGKRLEVGTLNEDTLKVNAAYGGVTVDGIKVVQADVAAANGVIHVIDGVLLP